MTLENPCYVRRQYSTVQSTIYGYRLLGTGYFINTPSMLVLIQGTHFLSLYLHLYVSAIEGSVLDHLKP